MSIPKDQAEIYKALVEKRLEKNLESLKQGRKALRLLDKEKTEPIYTVGLISRWKNVAHYDDEKDVLKEEKGNLRDILKATEKEFMKINKTG